MGVACACGVCVPVTFLFSFPKHGVACIPCVLMCALPCRQATGKQASDCGIEQWRQVAVREGEEKGVVTGIVMAWL